MPVRTRREADTADNLREVSCGRFPPPTRLTRSGGTQGHPKTSGDLKPKSLSPAGYGGGANSPAPRWDLVDPWDPAWAPSRATQRAKRAPHRFAAVLGLTVAPIQAIITLTCTRWEPKEY